ncbi:hypothetical protein PVL29_020443 [Vitis rotundifolia]|uniref:Uncharacterized protein n=1 Tax=Vitis rotundifolia TaxID=103349 RepID=A0AA38Z0R8_VITRO|nr:hypothetical protein PVL29_019532 [Vitis rotundifolia]KAJ9681574.1 hypothetical protein PVL29_020441 [Vitis rotundifolia]KAJ9681576.1 hypothetical protein PVL29_020443 [Vitis rotundifolia]
MRDVARKWVSRDGLVGTMMDSKCAVVMAEAFRRRRQAAGVLQRQLCLFYFFLNSSINQTLLLAKLSIINWRVSYWSCSDKVGIDELVSSFTKLPFATILNAYKSTLIIPKIVESSKGSSGQCFPLMTSKSGEYVSIQESTNHIWIPPLKGQVQNKIHNRKVATTEEKIWKQSRKETGKIFLDEASLHRS